jgi:hypothetical protein
MIIEVDRLPDHVLTAGLNLLETPSLSSEVDALGTFFMAAYILAPVPPVPQGLVSLSPMGNFEGRSLSFLGSTRHGGSVGSACLLHPTPLPPPVVPSHSTWLVGPSSHPSDSWGERRCPDHETGEQVSSQAPFLASGHIPSLIGYGGRYGNQIAWPPSLSSSSSSHWSPTHSKIFFRGGSNSLDIATIHWGSSSLSHTSLSLSGRFSIPVSIPGNPSAFTSSSLA